MIIIGSEIQEKNIAAVLCTLIGIIFLIFPVFFVCMDWKQCSLVAYDVPEAAYDSLG